ncbi:MAG: YceI family protein, partial [Actinobacteria bacterium]|nr:YceI family protein [Actinomycetota bacterium]
MIPSGTYDFGPSDATLHLHTKREGMAKKVGHDLILEVGKWQASATIDADDITRSTIQGTADATSIRVVSGTGGAKPLSDGDRKDIEKNINEKVLKTSQ